MGERVSAHKATIFPEQAGFTTARSTTGFLLGDCGPQLKALMPFRFYMIWRVLHVVLKAQVTTRKCEGKYLELAGKFSISATPPWKPCSNHPLQGPRKLIFNHRSISRTFAPFWCKVRHVTPILWVMGGPIVHRAVSALKFDISDERAHPILKSEFSGAGAHPPFKRRVSLRAPRRNH